MRAPARLNREVISPFGTVLGGPGFESEVAQVLEVGYRGLPFGKLSLSVTGFRHAWDKLRSDTALPVVIENRIEGPVYGAEGWVTWFAPRAWRLSGGFTALRKELRLEEGSTDPVGVANPQLANDRSHQWLLRSSLTIGSAHEARRHGPPRGPASDSAGAFLYGGGCALRHPAPARPGAFARGPEPLRRQPPRVRRRAGPE